MSLAYGLLRGRVVDFGREDNDPKSPHFQIVLEANGERWRAPVNVRSQDGSEVLFASVDPLPVRPLMTDLTNAVEGFTGHTTHLPGLALDYVREPLFDPGQLRHLPFTGPGANDDLQDLVELFVQQAKAQSGAELFVFGARFSAASNPLPVDKQFRTRTGVHDIHMNQGNPPPGSFFQDNGVYQDGGLVFHFPNNDRFVGVFFAFQTQSWRTDDKTGRPIVGPGPGPGPGTNPAVHIMAALVNPRGADPTKETVTLLNPGAERVDLQGWSIVDRQGNSDTLGSNMTLEPGESKIVRLSGKGAQLSNKGGVIRLLDSNRVQIDSVSYSAGDASREGRTVVF